MTMTRFIRKIAMGALGSTAPSSTRFTAPLPSTRRSRTLCLGPLVGIEGSPALLDPYETASTIAMRVPASDGALLAFGGVFPDAPAAATSIRGRQPSLVTLIGGERTLFDRVHLDVIAVPDM